jgi:hypothetical protein
LVCIGSPDGRTQLAPVRAGTLGPKGGEATEWKLFHQEKRPALERNIIDTSEWTCANYRYVIR